MTAVNLTLTATRAWLSADSAMLLAASEAPDTDHWSADPSIVAASAFADPPVTPRHADWYACKVAAFPESRMLVAGTGAVLPVRTAMVATSFSQGTGYDVLVANLPLGLRHLTRAAPTAAVGVVFLVGWSDEQGRCCAALLSSGNDWRPVSLQDGHCLSPMPHPDVEGYEDLWALHQAPAGQDVEKLHLAVAMNQTRAARAGWYRSAPAIGGDLTLGEVDRDGARSRVIGHLG